MTARRITVGIVLFDDVEVLDFCGPFEVFSVTRLDQERHREDPSPFLPLLVAKTKDCVATTGGMRVEPHTTYAQCPALDVLVVPGGWGTRAAMSDPQTISFVKERAAQVGKLASVCTGSLVLAQAGLLDGKRATTHWGALDRMAKLFPAVHVDRRLHVVEDGDVITSAGISAGIDMALTVVGRHCGEQVARETARYMEYPYPETLARRVAI